jgi:AraC-like DNA-binding protein
MSYPRFGMGAVVRQVMRRPSAVLAPFVEHLWYFQGDLPHVRERILPTGTMQLLVNLHEDELRMYHGAGFAQVERIGGAALGGAFTHSFAIDTAEQREIVGATFRPGGAFPFFAAPAHATVEVHAELGDLWGRDGAVVRERLCEAATPAAKLALLDAILRERAVRPLASDGSMEHAAAALAGGVAVGEVADRLGTSGKTFIRRFTERLGLTPKRYARVRRFQRVLDALGGGPPASWAELAIDVGYFDQAHLIHEFRALAGIRPTEYADSRTGGRNHVPLD